jgi:hypothetical protein
MKGTAMALRAKNPKHAKPKKPKILIYGKPGVGKTWGALDFPGAYLIDSEGGANLDHYTDKLARAGGAYMGPEDGANDMSVVLDQILSLATTKHEYRTLVIDSFSKLFNTAIAIEYERMESSKAFKDMTKTFGAEKKPAVARTKQMISRFDRLDMNVILICHEKALWKDGEQVGDTFDGWEKLEYELDLTMQIVKQGASRKARIGKCRLEQFREGESIEWGYLPFAKRYGLEVIEAPAAPVEPASADQIQAVCELANLVKLDEEIQLKWFDAAGVTSWGEMDSATVQKCIDHLTAKLPKAAAVA